ncbi:putative F-box/FBD/LRR-repeat protein At3g49040, partial [Vigna umbellata]|uniref:putative F-box/FBD/LRR-repeat protein At3g49040 n=1 Tax=Vigna umbellata TaxID=87088 RepID=UPI001F5F5A96
MLVAKKEESIDKISDLPLSIMFHIMESMDARYAVQTCVLSKQWKELWKRMASFSIKSNFRRVIDFNNFVSQFLSSRDGSISFSRVDIVLHRSSQVKKLNRIITYAALHHVQQMALHFCFYMLDSKFPSFNLPCSSLVYLHLTHKHFCHPVLKFPNSLLLPALKVLHLENLCFSASYGDYAEPFSCYNLLHTLILKDCSLFDTEELLISNSNLSTLSLHHMNRKPYKFFLSTPILSFLTMTGQSYFCNLSAENIKVGSWLKQFSNVKELTLPDAAVTFILEVLSKHNLVETQIAFFPKLESLKVIKDSVTSDEAVNTM